MEIFFTICIIFLIILYSTKRFKGLSITCFLILLLTLLIIFPSSALNAAKEGINLWLFIVVPSLLPFFIINDMLSSLKVPENISALFTPLVKKVFKTSGYGAYAFIMSIFAGYPSGAKIVSTLLEENKISKSEGEKILTFSSTSGPLFIIGAVGSGMLLNPTLGYILFISHIIGAIINGIFSRPFFKENFTIQSNKKALKLHTPSEDIILKGIKSSLITCGYIGGYIIFFCVILELVKNINLLNYISIFLLNLKVIPLDTVNCIVLFLESLIEVSYGSKIISLSSVTLDTKLVLLSFLIAFSGLAVIGQVSGILSSFKLNIKKYIAFKITHGIFSSIVCFIILKFNFFSITTINSSINATNPSLGSYLILFLIIILILNSIGFFVRKIKN